MKKKRNRFTVKLDWSVIYKKNLMLGTVVGLLGKESSTGAFEVQEVCYPGVAPQQPLPQSRDDSKYVALVSGLNVGADPAMDLKLQLLTEYLTGELGTMDVCMKWEKKKKYKDKHV